MKYGIIDVGSNTIRLSIYECEDGRIKLLMNKKEGKNPERDGKDIREAYHFYIGKTFFGALDHLLIHGDLLLSEVRYGLKDIRQQTWIRIRNTK